MSRFVRLDALLCTRDGVALFDLYNGEGGLFQKKGRSIPSSVGCNNFFVKEKDLPESLKEQLVSSPSVSEIVELEVGDEYVPPSSEVFVQEFVSESIANLYNSVKDDLENAFNGNYGHIQSVTNLKSVLDKTFDKDKKELYLCNKAFGGFSQGTSRHSFNVYILFCEALFEFRKKINDNAFYSLFKEKGSNINFSPSQIRKYAMGALLHDIGKVKIPQKILEKAEPLTATEREILQRHPRFGIEILEEIGETSAEMMQMVGNHHFAYPYFNGDKWSPLVEILSIVDIFDACRSPRPYKPAMPFIQCVRILYEQQVKNGWHPYIVSNLVEGVFLKFERAYQVFEKRLEG